MYRWLKGALAVLAAFSVVCIAAPVASAHEGEASVDCTTATWRFWGFPEGAIAELAIWRDGTLIKSDTARELGQAAKTFTLPITQPADGAAHTYYISAAWQVDNGGYIQSRTVTCPPTQPTPTPTPTVTPVPTPPAVTPVPTPTPPPLAPCVLTRVPRTHVRAGQRNVIRVVGAVSGTTITLRLPRSRQVLTHTSNTPGPVVFRVRPHHSGIALVTGVGCNTVRVKVRPPRRVITHRPPRITG